MLEFDPELTVDVVLLEDPTLLLLKLWEEMTVFLTPTSTRSMHVGQVRDLMSQSSMQRMW